ncbi:MAG: class I SAM-dependent methyltransferase, partial [Candidatus Paceibacterota bacterium]
MFSDPVKNLKALGLREDNVVVDLGAGTGFYSIAAGELVPKGKVYAIEIVKDFLATVRQRAKEANLNNVEALWGNIEKSGGTKIADAVADAAIASNE